MSNFLAEDFIKRVQGPGGHNAHYSAFALEIMLRLSLLSFLGARFWPYRECFYFVRKLERGFSVTAWFVGLRCEYPPLLPQIGRVLATYLKTPRMDVIAVAKAIGLPSVQVIILDPSRLMKKIHLPTLSGEWQVQKVKYSSFPNQCFVYRQIGHIARACPRWTQR